MTDVITAEDLMQTFKRRDGDKSPSKIILTPSQYVEVTRLFAGNDAMRSCIESSTIVAMTGPEPIEGRNRYERRHPKKASRSRYEHRS